MEDKQKDMALVLYLFVLIIGIALLIVAILNFAHKNKQITGIEPASPAWEADVLPMNYICIFLV